MLFRLALIATLPASSLGQYTDCSWVAAGTRATCTNVCGAVDGYCDDGGPGAEYDYCILGTDCTDCGSSRRRALLEEPTEEDGDKVSKEEKEALIQMFKGAWEARDKKQIKLPLQLIQAKFNSSMQSRLHRRLSTVNSCELQNLHDGDCGGFEKKHDACWKEGTFNFLGTTFTSGEEFCCAENSDDCCEDNVGAIVGVIAGAVVGLLLIIFGIVACCCFSCCKCCPCNKHNKKGVSPS